MKKLAYPILLLLIIAACNRSPKDDGTAPAPLFPQPKSIDANTKGGYIVNPVSGDTIQPIILESGDTLITGVPIPATPKIIHPDSVSTPKIVKVATELVEVNAHPNRHKIPDIVPTFKVDKSKIKTIPIQLAKKQPRGGLDTAHYIVNTTGDTVKTGIPIPATGKTVPTIQPQPTPALPPAFKDAAIANLQYLDVDQGMPSSYVNCVFEDQSGNLWFGTYGGGVTKYNGSSFTHYTKKEGLSNNYVMSILEDQSGNLWFGTLGGGVTKYNGSSFTHYTKKEGLSNNYVLSILEDQSGNLWFGTWGGGVTKYNGSSFTHYTEKEGLSNTIVLSILEDQSGNLWFGTSGGGVTKYNGSSFTHYTEKEGLSNNYVRSILEDQSGNLWFGTDGGGVTKYNGSSFTHYTEKEGLSNNIVKSILEDQSGNLWFGTDGGGVTKYNGSSFTHYTEKEGLSNNYVRSILEDQSGNLWFGTYGGGVTKYNGSSFTHYTEKEGLSSNYVKSILEDQSGNLWFGTDGGGVTKYNGSSFTHYTKKEGLSNNYVLSILEDQSGNLWFGTSGRGVTKYNGSSFTHYTEKEGLSNNIVMSILEDQSGNLWFGTSGGGVTKYNGSSFTHYTEKEGLSNNYVWSILEDQSGNLWFGTSGVTKYNGSSFTHYTEKEGLSNNGVLSILEDQSGNLWFGTSGGGVTKYNGSSFTHYTEKEGLSNNYVWSILEDQSNNVWVSTEKGLKAPKKGLTVFAVGDGLGNHPQNEKKMKKVTDEETFGIMTFGKQDGLKGVDFFINSAFIDSKNRAWWGSGKGLEMLDLNKFSTATKPPAIFLKQLDINEQFIDYRNISDSFKNEIYFDSVVRFENYPLNLELSYDKNHLTFHFVAIDWSAPHKIQYSYRMLGLDNSWSNPSKEGKAEYRNLSYGTYTFQIKAIGESGKWSEPFEYTFTISPPWWHTWWFRVLLVCSSLFIIYLVFKWRTKSLRERQKHLEKTVEERTADVVEEKRIVEEQKELIEIKQLETEQQKHLVEEKNREILDSITYAKRIQSAILPQLNS
jgi:ligand-binding sensor domain-containing protein